MNISNKNTLSPVVVFTYNRLSNTRHVIEALQKNHLASETELYVFSDGPKNKGAVPVVQSVRDYLSTITGFKKVNIIERERNYYIEQNIIQGVTEIVNKHGKIIVLEDDGVTSPNFLNFMNDALNFYQDTTRVMHVATFTFIDMPKDFRETFFWRYTENTGGGWATWADRWKKFEYFAEEEKALASLTEDQKKYLTLDGVMNFLGTLKFDPIPWDICWYMTLVRNDGLAVNSPRALTVNNGLYNGTHFSPINRILGRHPFAAELDGGNEIIFSDDIKEHPEAFSKLQDFYRNLGQRKRDKMLHYFVRTLVFFRVTKLIKWILKKKNG